MDEGGSTSIPEGKKLKVECPYCHMLMDVPYHSAGVRFTCKSCQGVTHIRFSGDARLPVKPAGESIAENIGIVLGLLLFIGGIALAIGNMSGAFPTFPYAGFILSGAGLLLVALVLEGGD